MATKTLNLKSTGVYIEGASIASYDANKFTTDKVSGKSTAKIAICLDLETIFGDPNVIINSATLKYKAVSNRSLSTYKQGTVRSGYFPSSDSTSRIQVYEYVESTAKEGKTPTSYSDEFKGTQCNTRFKLNISNELKNRTVVMFYIEMYNPGSFNLQVFFTEVSLVFDYTVPTYTVKVSASPEEGGIVGGGGTFTYNDSTTITATPNEGYTFIKWVITTAEGASGEYTQASIKFFTVPTSYECTAYFEKLPPPEFTSVSMTYLNKQISSSNKVICKEGFIISVAVT